MSGRRGLEEDAKVIQLSILRFEFSKYGRIFALCPCESWLEDPRIPIPREITELAEITHGDVAGQRIDDARVAELVGDAAFVIAHKARFDRPRLESRLPIFIEKAWSRSCDDVDWLKEGLGAQRLEWLGYRSAGCSTTPTWQTGTRRWGPSARAAAPPILAVGARGPTGRGSVKDCPGLGDLPRQVDEGCPQGPEVPLQSRRRRAADGLVKGNPRSGAG
ncbi:MAG: hypothetical protein U0164_01880 [Gemmatimonadaceae bacterium]